MMIVGHWEYFILNLYLEINLIYQWILVQNNKVYIHKKYVIKLEIKYQSNHIAF